MDKILFLNEKDRNTGLSLEHSDYSELSSKVSALKNAQEFPRPFKTT